MTINTDKIDDLKQELESRCRKLKREDRLRPVADVALASLTQRFYEELKSLEPFGEGNQAPVFRSFAFVTPKRWPTCSLILRLSKIQPREPAAVRILDGDPGVRVDHSTEFRPAFRGEKRVAPEVRDRLQHQQVR